MSVRGTSGLARNTICTAVRVRHASTTALRRSTKKPSIEHGSEIFVYNHLQTNQVIYSLTKALKNNASLKQLPYNGKKTVPRALRKDHWHPLAKITFPQGSGPTGLTVFHKLREYRRLHELQWPDSYMRDKEGKLISRKQRGRNLCDQKANSVADMAAVLGMIGKEDGPKVGLKSMEDGSTVEVRWSDLVDAEFAETWSPNVIHDVLPWHNNNRVATPSMKHRKAEPKLEEA